MKKLFFLLVIILLVLAIAGLIFLQPQLKIATGYAAKKACSYHYISGRSLESITKVDLADFPLSLVSLDMARNADGVVASVLGMQKATAIKRPGLGCALLQGNDDFKIARTNPSSNLQESSQLPYSKSYHVDTDQLDKAFESALDIGYEWEKKTLGLMVIHRDSILKEQYARDFDPETEFLGWSMTKSVCNLLVGILSRKGIIDIDQDNLYPAWENDERKNIKIKNLLQMNSGLQWTEEYEEVCDITQGLFKEEDFVKFTYAKPLESPIGETYEYSSGSTNLISGVLRRQLESYQDYLNLPYKELFEPLGIHDAYMETDEAGNYIMSSYLFAKARDWAKLGMLYKNKGNWQGQQLIDTSYIEWSLTPSDAEPGYGAQIFLNTDHSEFKTAPESAYKFSGYDGQYVIVIPSHDLIIVRFGLSKGPPFDLDEVIMYAIKAVT